MAPPILTLRDIELTFGGTPLLEGASLSVSDGDRLALVGRNGSGKSTLLKIAAGLIEPDGGVIAVAANDAADSESLGRIRRHLAQVAESFARGDFSMPLAIHDRVLPGVAEMTRLAGAIQYRYEELERGAQVRIATQDPAAREAIHAFLAAQIADHRTGH